MQKGVNMLYHLHFDEDNCPYGDEPLSHDIFIDANKSINIKKLLNEVSEIKSQMDCCNDENEPDAIYEEYCDCGWNDKIDAAIDIVARRHPKWAIKIVKIKSYSIYIN
jgi:hypothetical protein